MDLTGLEAEYCETIESATVQYWQNVIRRIDCLEFFVD